MIIKMNDKIRDLEEENKKLIELSEHKTEVIMNLWKRKDELEEENKELKAKINKVIELFNEWDSSDLYDYIDDLDYEEI